MMFERHSLKVNGYSAIAPYVRCQYVITTQDMKPQLDFDISTKQYSAQETLGRRI